MSEGLERPPATRCTEALAAAEVHKIRSIVNEDNAAGRQAGSSVPVMTECLPGVDDDGVIVEQPQRRTGVTELLRAWQPVSGKPRRTVR